MRQLDFSREVSQTNFLDEVCQAATGEHKLRLQMVTYKAYFEEYTDGNHNPALLCATGQEQELARPNAPPRYLAVIYGRKHRILCIKTVLVPVCLVLVPV